METFNDFLGHIPRDIRTRLLVWLDHDGPFWDDQRQHSDNEYFESCNEIVTDTGAAEAACIRAENTLPTWLFSLEPSKFLSDPLTVSWLGRADGDVHLEIPNGWRSEHVERCALELEQPFSTWEDLLLWTERECRNLLLSKDIRQQLPIQFIPNVGQRARVLLSVLNQIVGYLKDKNDQAFQKIRADWMQGNRARFTSSSDLEITQFANELTFRHPESGRNILCSWHGKIQTPQFRIHFEWPLPENAERLFIAYIGPKITKQ